MTILEEIRDNMQRGKGKIVVELVKKALDDGVPVKDILEEGLLSGMNQIGEQFKNNEIFVPEVLVAARAMNMGVEVLKPLMAASGVEPIGKVCLGTVKGDLHDIGKNLVRMMMEGKGLKVIDLGVDVPASAFVEAARENNAKIIACSALLTTTMGEMKTVVDAVKASDLNGQVKVMVGGAPITESFAQSIGADCYTPDATAAAAAALAFCAA